MRTTVLIFFCSLRKVDVRSSSTQDRESWSAILDFSVNLRKTIIGKPEKNNDFSVNLRKIIIGKPEKNNDFSVTLRKMM